MLQVLKFPQSRLQPSRNLPSVAMLWIRTVTWQTSTAYSPSGDQQVLMCCAAVSHCRYLARPVVLDALTRHATLNELYGLRNSITVKNKSDIVSWPFLNPRNIWTNAIFQILLISHARSGICCHVTCCSVCLNLVREKANEKFSHRCFRLFCSYLWLTPVRFFYFKRK